MWNFVTVIIYVHIVLYLYTFTVLLGWLDVWRCSWQLTTIITTSGDDISVILKCGYPLSIEIL